MSQGVTCCIGQIQIEKYNLSHFSVYIPPAKVEMMGNKTVVSGKPVTLSCKYILSERIHQVLWTKTAEQGDTTSVASYYKNGKPIVKAPFHDRVSLNPSLGQTQLSIQQAQTDDEGCYTCEFHTYPDGSKSATACLSVYGKSKLP